MRKHVGILLAAVLSAGAALAQSLPNRSAERPAVAQTLPSHWAVVLSGQPAAARFSSRAQLMGAEGRNYRQQLALRQAAVRSELESRRYVVTGSDDTLLNAVFISASAGRAAELRGMAGVLDVIPMRNRQLDMNRATALVNASSAWSAVGGTGNAGAGIKIAIIDTGVDVDHLALQDSTLSVPSGFPICTTGHSEDCKYTNTKVIVARSYVRQLAAGTDSSNPSANSRPDDYTPRDHVGHGTATSAVAAGAAVTDGTVSFRGMAPKAWIGSYKVMGSPGVNDYSTDDVLIQAVSDALNDGMDIANISIGSQAFYGALDAGSVCGNAAGVPCDPFAYAVEQAVQNGLVVVTSAGNSGASGTSYPSYSSMGSPGTAPSAIAAGASTNSHYFSPTVGVVGATSSSGVASLAAAASDSYIYTGALSAPMVAVSTLGNDGYACAALTSGSLKRKFALIQRSPSTGSSSCGFATKVANAVDAGAIGVVFYNRDASSTLIQPSGVSSYYIPTVMLSYSDGVALKNYLASNSGATVRIDQAGTEVSSSTGDEMAYFSSKGPTPDLALKPDVTAPGTSIYTATQKLDPASDMYSETGYAAVDGTSFSSPMTAGAAALVLQAHPSFTPAQVKSAIANSANRTALTLENYYGYLVDAQWMGAGRLDAQAAVNAVAVASPTSASFGAVSGTMSKSQTFTITNTGSSSLTFAVAVTTATVNNTETMRQHQYYESGTTSSTGVTPTVDKTSITLAAGASTTLTLSLTGTAPATGGSYTGAVTLTASSTSLQIPYLYIVADGLPYSVFYSSYISATAGQSAGTIPFKVVDQFGVPVSNCKISFTITTGATLSASSATTDAYGIAAVDLTAGTSEGAFQLTATVANYSYGSLPIYGYVYPQPQINAITNAADYSTSVAPGSYVNIWGTGLVEPEAMVDSTNGDSSPSVNLPLQIDYVAVSFDVPSAGISVPGRIQYVGPTQINVQVPWELQGQTSAKVKVTYYSMYGDYVYGKVYTVSLTDVAPAFYMCGTFACAVNNDTGAQILAASPAAKGSWVQVYANGLGPLQTTPTTGSPLYALDSTSNTATVTIGGVNATVGYSGLNYYYPNLYQLNVQIPSGAPSGTQAMILTIGGKTATGNIAVQ
jgi:minor extracellular serine protease Vpr